MMKSYLIAFGMSFLLLIMLNNFLGKISKKYNKKIERVHYIFGYLFMLYLMIALKEVVGFPSISEWQRFSNLNIPIYNPNINLVPFADGIEISGILNIIFFMPFGFLLPTLWTKYRKLLPTLCYGLAFSSIIELAQLFTNGRGTDVNDLIMNTLGTVLGWIVFKIMMNIFIKLSNKTVVESYSKENVMLKLEPYLYVAISIISTFLS